MNVPKVADYNQQCNNIILKYKVALPTVMNKRWYEIACIGVCHHTSAADCYKYLHIYEQQNKFPFEKKWPKKKNSSTLLQRAFFLQVQFYAKDTSNKFRKA